MILEYKLKIIKRLIFLSGFLFILTMLFIEAFNYKIGIMIFGYKGELPFMIVLTLIITLSLVFIVDVIRYHLEGLILRIFITSVIILMSMTLYVMSQFLFPNRLTFFKGPNDETLFFVSEYTGGGLHHQRYETTLYIKVAPLTYQSLGMVHHLNTFIQDDTINKSFVDIEFNDDTFTMYITDYVEGEKVIYQQTFIINQP